MIVWNLARSSWIGWNLLFVASAANGNRIFDDNQVAFFQREGYLKVSGLLGECLTSGLAEAARQTIETSPTFPFYYSVSQSGVLFGTPSSRAMANKHDRNNCTSPSFSPSACSTSTSNPSQSFRQAALYSKLPQAGAELMKLDPSQHNLRVLRDVFLAKDVEDPECCDWHVDDLGFWPQSYLPAQGIDGVNVWIALDDMPAAFQGSMAVAPGSHTAKWRNRAYLALGQNRSEDGGRSKEDIIRRLRVQQQNVSKDDSGSSSESKEEEEENKPQFKYPTCDIRLTDPDISATIDSIEHVFDLKRGDIIFATRLLFHRTLPVTKAGQQYFQEQGQQHLSRYSIRYVPGTARLPQGWSVEWSIVDDFTNAGRSLDKVVEQQEEGSNNQLLFYPQVWPSRETSLRNGLEAMEVAVPSLASQAQAEYMAMFGPPQPEQTSSSS